MNEPSSEATPSREVFASDETLVGLLEAAGVAMAPSDVISLVAGIAAAPEPRDPLASLALMTPAPTPELAEQLLARVRAKRSDYAAALGAGPAPAERLESLRAELGRRDLQGFVVPLADEHQGEYVPPGARRLAWLTGFRGSAGVAVVLENEAAVFVDGRYTLQAGQQVDTNRFALRHLVDEPAHDWIAANLPAGARLGYDPWLHTRKGVERLAAAVKKAGAELAPCADNPLDTVWPDQPPAPLSPVRAHDLAFAGEESAEKRTRIANELMEAKVDAAVLTDPSSVAWLLNIRGGDVTHTPLPLSFAIVHADASVDLFIDPRKLGEGARAHLGEGVRPRPPGELGPALAALGAQKKTVRADTATQAAWVFDRLAEAGAVVAHGPDPCALPKARKNDVEISGTRAAHLRDGAALTRFLAWLEREAPGGAVDEIAAARALEGFRAGNEHFQGLSFDTISGSGPNGAIVHYRVSEASNRRLEPGDLYLVDSGAQYLDGTTDVTRTLAIGEAGPEPKARFTAVLKGHIALATARFPEGTTGASLDAFARRALWRLGLDYDHGTGHGVGSYLGVHEGPQRISKLPNAIALVPGMIVSNEPGYYKAGAYGIRIENLVTVVAIEDIAGAEKPVMGFETLTRAPIDLALVEPAHLTPDEIAWLDAYHAEVRRALTPLVDADTAAWLEHATRPVAELAG